MSSFKERNKRIATEYESGRTILEIAGRYGLTRQRAHQVLLKQGVTMRRRGKPTGKTYMYLCQKCGAPFESQSSKRVYCSRQCGHEALRRYSTPEEKEENERAKKAKAALRASKYYHNVFKKKENWQDIVRERNFKKLKG